MIHKMRFINYLMAISLIINGLILPISKAGTATWTQVNTDGFGLPNTAGIYDMISTGFAVYAATDKNDNSGAYIYRSTNGTTWQIANSLGFGNNNNSGILTAIAFKNYLYATTYNFSTGTEVWRCAYSSLCNTQSDWYQVNTDGFGNSQNYSIVAKAIFNNFLYYSTSNITTGTEVWRSSDGTTWTQVVSGGFADNKNTGGWGFTAFKNYLYLFTRNTDAGFELCAVPKHPAAMNLATGQKSAIMASVMPITHAVALSF